MSANWQQENVRVQTLFKLSGAVAIGTVGLTSNLEVHWINNDNTISRNASGAAKGWHRIECWGANEIAIVGSAKVLAPGGLTTSSFQQIRPVALGLPHDFGRVPMPCQGSPLAFATGNYHQEMQLEIWPMNMQESHIRQANIGGGPQSEGAHMGILPITNPVVVGNTVHFAFRLKEPTTSFNWTLEGTSVARQYGAIRNTNVIYLALGLNQGAVTGNLTTTRIECDIAAVMSR